MSTVTPPRCSDRWLPMSSRTATTCARPLPPGWRPAPRGGRVVRLPAGPAEEEADDLEALANAVREASVPRAAVEPVGQGVEVGRRGHLRVLRSGPPPDRGGL